MGEDVGRSVAQAPGARELDGWCRRAIQFAPQAPPDAGGELYTLDAGRFAEQSCAERAVVAEQQPQEAPLDVEAEAEPLASLTLRSEAQRASQQAERQQSPVEAPQKDAVEQERVALAAPEAELVFQPAERLQRDAPEVPASPLAPEEKQRELPASQL